MNFSLGRYLERAHVRRRYRRVPHVPSLEFVRILAFTFLVVFCSRNGFSQVIPSDNAILNYTQVLFEVAEVKNAVMYRFIITEDVAGQGKASIVQIDSSQVTIVKNLKFGKHYKWKVAAMNSSGKTIHETQEYHFRISSSALVDSSFHRFRVIRNNESEVKDGVIFLDYSRVAIDRDGQPVWFMPAVPGVETHGPSIRDLELTRRSTVTFLNAKFCKEISLDGKVMWETPKLGADSSVTAEFFHHEFTLLPTGNYLALGTAVRNRSLTVGDQTVERIPVSVILEYNRDKDTVWSWYSDNYISDSDLVSVGKKVFRGSTFGHMNSAFVNAERNEVYACFRDLNSILVIDRSTGSVVRSYGDKIPSDTTWQGIGFFNKQHSPILMPDGDIIVFNNNELLPGKPTEVLIFNESFSAGDTSAIVWNFACDFDTLRPGKAMRLGNAQPLDSNHILVNMGDAGRLFEVNLDKRILWDCLPEKIGGDSVTWMPDPNYRLAFSSSLYPYYFSFSLRKHETDGTLYLFVVNEGTEDDRYTITISSLSSDSGIPAIDSVSVRAGCSYRLPLDMVTDKKYSKGFSIEVRSANNDLLNKKETYNNRK